MFRGTFQTGYLTVFNAVGSKPLQLWETDGEGWCLKFFFLFRGFFFLFLEGLRVYSIDDRNLFFNDFFPSEASFCPCHFLVVSRQSFSLLPKGKEERGRRAIKRRTRERINSLLAKFPLIFFFKNKKKTQSATATSRASSTTSPAPPPSSSTATTPPPPPSPALPSAARSSE